MTPRSTPPQISMAPVRASGCRRAAGAPARGRGDAGRHPQRRGRCGRGRRSGRAAGLYAGERGPALPGAHRADAGGRRHLERGRAHPLLQPALRHDHQVTTARSADRPECGEFFRVAERDAFRRLLASGDGKSASAELTLVAESGRDVPVNVSIIDLMVEEGASRVICGVVTDLTRSRRRNHELAAANAQLATEIEERGVPRAVCSWRSTRPTWAAGISTSRPEPPSIRSAMTRSSAMRCCSRHGPWRGRCNSSWLRTGRL